KQASVLRIINAFRVRGHQQAAIDPIDYRPLGEVPDLDPTFHGLTEQDLDTVFNTGSLAADASMPLRDILNFVQRVYTGPIGAEYMHVTSTDQKRWMQARLEGTRLDPGFNAEQRKHIYGRVAAAEGLERYLHTKYVGQKRFSLEGGESLIPALDEIIQRSGAQGIKETVVGMAHRGRLNVLVNILGKNPAELFAEFEGRKQIASGSGDVKYHMGFSSDVVTAGGHMHLALAFNPSHLEIANPVVEGSVKARQVRRGDESGAQVLPILIHGDAAFAGQGVVSETLNMSRLQGYDTGGMIRLVVNNQIGFTTSDPLDARSTHYCTDVAKMVNAPILHVNGDDPESVVFAAQIALDYRMEFRRDVVLDIVCYRRHGHNEADEPAATQPTMYQKIRQRPTTLEVYGKRLEAEGVMDDGTLKSIREGYRDALDDGRCVANGVTDKPEPNEFAVNWGPYIGSQWDDEVSTAVPEEELKHLAELQLQLPDGFPLHPRVAKIIEARGKMAMGGMAMDWGFAETLAYATLIKQGYPIRLSGQDCERGTFFHRHSVLHNIETGEEFTPLANLFPHQKDYTVINSVLSEEAVLGFEYGYATAEPDTLTIWEAQFGDFANGAQVVIDQFITSGETKWGRLCGLAMFLPHGMEGQGPEHSSARLERYLQLCAEKNIQVCVPTTPAQAFHMIRRQMVRPYRKPLIVMTPKSLLRHKLAVSTLDDLAQGRFQNVIDEIDDLSPGKVERVVMCSGKVFYDLLEERRKRELDSVAIIRIEQLYPFPRAELRDVLKRYTHAKELVWCQEEPRNQGAWYPIQHRLLDCKRPRQTLRYAGRDAAASPAAGYMSLHVAQQKALVDDALS
ncbi:MAG: 2-oxoglutarate dehydrogenase E1 component, partial [Gammaproteobacteria bacterium]